MSDDLDMSEFQDIFFEECSEGLDIMENGLLTLDENADLESINTIFRAAHSIKGGGGTFGFFQITEFTHVVETLLGEMREGDRVPTKDVVNLLLISVDVLRAMTDALQYGSEMDEERNATVKAQLEAVLAGDSGAADGDGNASEGGEPPEESTAEEPEKQRFYLSLTSKKPVPESLAEEVESALMAVDTVSAEDRIIHPERDVIVAIEVSADSTDDVQKAVAEMAQPDGDSWAVGEEVNLEDLEEADKEEEEDSADAGLPNAFVLTPKFDFDVDDPEPEPDEQPEEAASAPVDSSAPMQKSPFAAAAKAAAEAKEEIKQVAPTPPAPAAPPPAASAPATAPKPPVAPKAAAAKTPPAAAKKDAAKGAASIRVNTEKVDEIINLVGELVITQSILSQCYAQISKNAGDDMRNGIDQLERNTRELQESVMKIRMLPISFVFNRFPRMVRDVSTKLNKEIELELVGEQTELDKTVLENISDPMVHLLRNSLDHGIESPDEREKAGKPRVGKVTLEAYHEGGNVVIEIKDDGRGLDKSKIFNKAVEKGLISPDEILPDDKVCELIFLPGFSTADVVSDVSGRGVGMDVVKRNIRELGGNIEVTTREGEGSQFKIKLPLTLAIIDGQLARVEDQTFIVPLLTVIESLQVEADAISTIANQVELYRFRDNFIPIVRLANIFGFADKSAPLTKGLLIVVDGEGTKVGLFVDELMGQQQVVIKGLEANYRSIMGISGATILGDGRVALILDIAGITSNKSWVDNPNEKKDESNKGAGPDESETPESDVAA